MAPIDEKGAVWKFNTSTGQWSTVSPVNAANVPEPRSYHCSCSNQKDTIYVHAGCPEKGRLSDLWSFNPTTKQWKQLASAPDPSRGGTSITFADGKLYRMNGFDGKTEQGGSIDVYTPETDSWETHTRTSRTMNPAQLREVFALCFRLLSATSLTSSRCSERATQAIWDIKAPVKCWAMYGPLTL